MLNVDVCIPTVNGVPDQIINELRKETNGKIHISYAKPLVKARIELISKVETTLFLFLDDDVVYPPYHLTKLYEAMMGKFYFNIPNNTGAIQGQTVPSGLGKLWDKALSQYIMSDLSSEIIGENDRIMSSNALIFTHLVKDWIPKRDVSGCEDLDLTRHIQGKGCSCVVVPLFIQHKRTWSKVKSNGLWYARGYVNVMGKWRGLKQVFKLLLGMCKYSLVFLVNPYVSIYTVYQNYYAVKGLLRAVFLEGFRHWM